MKYILSFLLCCTALAQQTVNNFTVKTNLTVNGTATLPETTITGWTPSLNTRANASLFFGDSVVKGASASNTTNTWWYLVSSYYKWSYTNVAFSGAVVTDLNWQSQFGFAIRNDFDNIIYYTPSSTVTNMNVFAKVGINDAEDFPSTSGQYTNYLTHYYHSWLYFASWWATPSKILAINATKTGVWSNWTNYFGKIIGVRSSNSGDTLTFTTMGDVVYVGFPVSITNTVSFGKFWVSIDGSPVELVDPNGTGFGNRNQWTTPSSGFPYTATNAFWAKRYAGYGERRHSVVITATNNTSYPTTITWIAGSQQSIGQSSGPSVFLLENLNRSPNTVRDRTFADLRWRVQQVASYLGSDGLQVTLVRPNNYYNYTNSTDGVHPNDDGMTQVTRSVQQAIDRFRGIGISTDALMNASSIMTGIGSPEGLVIASPGAIYLSNSGGAGTTLYVKETGTGNTGWVGK